MSYTFGHKFYSRDIIYRTARDSLVRLMTCWYCPRQKGFFKNFVVCDVFGRWGSHVAAGHWELFKDRWGTRDKLAFGGGK